MTLARKADWLSRRIRAAVGQRLLLGLAPALLAVVLVVVLAYYGELGRQAPEYVIGGAAALALTSLALTWWNTRYLVERLRRLGRVSDKGDGDTDESTRDLDEWDRIEREVTHLKRSLETASAERLNERERLERRLQEQATLTAATLRGVMAQVDEVRLPLHILLDTRFGELNENQEELLVAARDAADTIDAATRRLALVADADRSALNVRREPVALNDVVRAIAPMVRAAADRSEAHVDARLEPALPRVWANRASLAEALALLANQAAQNLARGGTLVLRTDASPTHCAITVSPVSASAHEAPVHIVSVRMLEEQGARVLYTVNEIRIELPRALTPTLP